MGQHIHPPLISEQSLDDLLRGVFTALLNCTVHVEASRGGFSELLGCTLHLTDPRARLSRTEEKGKIFSALGELMWYLSGHTRLDFIDYYVPGTFAKESDDGQTVRSGYGERLMSFRGIDQVSNVIRLLRERGTTRRAVIQLFDASDLTGSYTSIPCTCTLQFLLRDGRLHMFVAMRSNDAYLGLPHDVFSFTMLQELVARSIDAELGEYTHFAASLHLYDLHRDAAQRFLDEAWQSLISMPEMPKCDPWPAVKTLQSIEQELRSGQEWPSPMSSTLDPYWRDLGLMLAAYQAAKTKDVSKLELARSLLQSDIYKIFVQARIDKVAAAVEGQAPGQVG